MGVDQGFRKPLPCGSPIKGDGGVPSPQRRTTHVFLIRLIFRRRLSPDSPMGTGSKPIVSLRASGKVDDLAVLVPYLRESEGNSRPLDGTANGLQVCDSNRHDGPPMINTKTFEMHGRSSPPCTPKTSVPFVVGRLPVPTTASRSDAKSSTSTHGRPFTSCFHRGRGECRSCTPCAHRIEGQAMALPAHGRKRRCG